MSDEWDGKVVMSTPCGPIVEMSLGDLLARKDAEIERLRAEVQRHTRHVEQLYDQIRRRADERDKAQIEVKRLREALESKP